jgi:hypothetical protein
VSELIERVKEAAAQDSHRTVVWSLAFIVVGVLVGLGRVEPRVLEMMLMAVAGMSVPRKSAE